MRKSLLLGILGTALLASSLAAEEIVLKDGTKVVGKIVGVKGETFLVRTSYGEMRIPRSDVITINFPENQPQPEAKELRPIDESLEKDLYVNRTEGFRVNVPEGWISVLDSFRTDASADVVTALSPPDRTLFFMVTPEKYEGSLNSYRGLAEIQYQTNFNEYEKVSEAEIQLDGRTGIRLVWRAKNKENGAPLKSLVIILPYEGKMQRLSFLTVEPLFDEALPTFENILKSYATIEP